MPREDHKRNVLRDFPDPDDWCQSGDVSFEIFDELRKKHIDALVEIEELSILVSRYKFPDTTGK